MVANFFVFSSRFAMDCLRRGRAFSLKWREFLLDMLRKKQCAIYPVDTDVRSTEITAPAPQNPRENKTHVFVASRENTKFHRFFETHF